MEAERRERILVLKLGALGDLIIGEGVMRAIRAHHKRAHITLMTEPVYARFMQNAPHFDAIIPEQRYPRWHLHKLYKTRQKLRGLDFDLVYNLQNSRRSKMLERWLRPARICSKFKGADYHYDLDAAPRLATREHLAAQVAQVGVDTHDVLPDIRWAGAPDAEVRAIMAAHNLAPDFVLLIPGSSARHPQKRWPHYGALAAWLVQHGIVCATAPGPDEMELCRTIPATMLTNNNNALNFNQLIGLGAHCRFVVGNDTGPTHLMAAARTNGLALFGRAATPAAHTGIGDIYDVIEADSIDGISLDDVGNCVLKGI